MTLGTKQGSFNCIIVKFRSKRNEKLDVIIEVNKNTTNRLVSMYQD